MKKVIVPHPKNYFEPGNWRFVVIVLAVIFIAILSMVSCTHVKKTQTETKQVETKGKDSVYIRLTNTVYTDTGTTTTYYRDSVIFRHDTAFQPIEKVVNKYYKKALIHDSIFTKIHDTTTVIKVVKETEKTKTSLPLWFWVVVGGSVAFGLFVLIKKI